jgi:CheY-like chemotaxis protein/anti-sigma regulatory factor (Ser/Thr protein kinase)
VVLKKSPMDLNRVVAAAVEGCLRAAQERGHSISVRFATDALPVHADAVRIEQIVANLVNNASKFSPEPGGIDVETSVEGGFAVVCVQDRGIGFAPDAADRLFDPFLQMNPTLERSAGGLGMGLTIVRRLAELHGGSVQAHSEGTGKGARFAVRIPLAERAAQPESASTKPDPGPRRRQSIVVIEDNPDIRESLRMLLAMWGHEVAMAEDGPSGVELVLRQRPEVALIDVGLPGMNGYDVARAIRKVHSHREMRLVAVTGYGQPSDREMALQSGFDEHVLKPIAPEALSRLLSE